LEEQSKKLPRIVDIPEKMQKRFGKGKMLIPKPLDVEAVIKKVPRGKLITQQQIREMLATKFKVKVTCPITTGIFVRMIANAAEEERELGKENITPWWRVVKNDGSLNEKFPGSGELQKKLLEKEGHKIVCRGKKYVVVDFFRFVIWDNTL